MIRQIKAIAPRVGIWAGRARKPIFFLYLVMGTQLSLSPCHLRFFLVYNIGMASTLCLFPLSIQLRLEIRSTSLFLNGLFIRKLSESFVDAS